MRVEEFTLSFPKMRDELNYVVVKRFTGIKPMKAMFLVLLLPGVAIFLRSLIVLPPFFFLATIVRKKSFTPCCIPASNPFSFSPPPQQYYNKWGSVQVAVFAGCLLP